MRKDECDKINAIVKLGLWLIFIAVLMIFSRYGCVNENRNIKIPQNELIEIENEF